MLGPTRLLKDRQRALDNGPRTCKVALVVKHAAEVAQARSRVGMLWAERLFADRQRIAHQRRSLRVSCASAEIAASTGQKHRLGVGFAQRQQMRCKLGAQ